MRHVISTRRVPNPDVDGRPQDTERAREEREGCRLWPLRPFLACKGTRHGGRPAARPSEPSLRAAARAARAMTMYIRVTCVRCAGDFLLLFQCFQLMLVVVGVSGVWWCGVFRCCACYVFFVKVLCEVQVGSYPRVGFAYNEQACGLQPGAPRGCR